MVSQSGSNAGGTSAGQSGPWQGTGALVPASNGERFSVAAAPRPDILSVNPRPIDVVYALRRRWGWALGLGLLSAAVAVLIAWWLIPVNYTATAWLRIAEEKPQIMFSTKGGDELLGHRQAQATLMTSNFVLNAALKKPGVAQLPYVRDEVDPVTFMRENLRVNFPGNSEIMQIAMTGDDPMQLVAVVNAVQNAYMDEVVMVDRDAHLRRKRLLQQSYERNMEQIKKKTYTYNELANSVGSADSEVARKKQINALDSYDQLKTRVNELRRQISGMDRREAILKSRLEILQNTDNPQADPKQSEEAMLQRLVELGMSQDPWIANARSQLAALEYQAFEEQQRAAQGENAPSVLRYEERMKMLKDGIIKRRKELEPQMTAYVKEQLDRGVPLAPPTPAELVRGALEQVELEKAVLEEEKKTALETFEKEAKEMEKLSSYSADLETRKSELDRLRKITEKMGIELEQWEIELAAPPRVTVLEAASVPRSNDIERKYRIVAFIGVAALAMAVMGVVGVDFLTRPVNSPTEVAYGLGLQVMGDLPLIAARSRRRRLNGAMPSHVQGMLIESIDNIRTALLHRAQSESIRVVLVTSALAKEGKTTLASQLAASLARSGRRTLYVDGDLRRPTAHRLFELPLTPGLSEVLREEVALPDIIRPTRVAGLWLAAAGACDVETVESLARGGLNQGFAALRNEFDFIIIDSGPVLTDSDALLFGQFCDAVILSVLRDVSRVPRVFEACERLRAVDLRILGAVVNGVSAGKYRSYYRPYTIEVESAQV